jgi:hypothetical protein
MQQFNGAGMGFQQIFNGLQFNDYFIFDKQINIKFAYLLIVIVDF